MQFSTLKSILAVLMVIGALCSLTALGFAAILTPPPTNRWCEAGKLSDLIAGGPPVLVNLVAEKRDYWVRYPDQPIGCAFLRRMAGGDKILALRGDHSEYHISVQFNEQRGVFQSCCWVSEFDLDGRELPPRWRNEDLQQLPVKIAGDEICVDFAEPSIVP